VRRHLYVAACSWLLSAIAHGTSLVALGLFQSDPPAGIARIIESIELEGSFSADMPRTQTVQLISYQEPASVPAVAAPDLPPAAPAVDHSSPPPLAAQANPPPIAPPHPATIAETQLFGVRGRGNRFVYVFDRSSSMEGAPLAAAKRELLASLAALSSANQFQVIFYNQQPQPMPAFRGGAATMTAADELGKRQAASFAGSIFADGATDHLAALRMALGLRPDVLFLLTDANEPRLSPAELVAIRRLNRQTTIHAIEFGLGPPQRPLNFLQQLAMENGGQHTYIDVTLLRGGTP
jgi:hypothetical protein